MVATTRFATSYRGGQENNGKDTMNRLKTGWLEEREETRDTLGQSHGRQLKRNPNDLKRNPNDLKRKPKPS
ncbi:unnamed protein product [Gadus morhua 'NCC']